MGVVAVTVPAGAGVYVFEPARAAAAQQPGLDDYASVTVDDVQAAQDCDRPAS